MKHYPNILLIAGTGRNVGKTMLACGIIRHLSKTTDVTGVKVSPHFHPVEKEQILIAKTTRYRVTEETKETLHTGKDSSRMLKAGAARVFYIQAEEADLGEAFNAIAAEIKVGPVICESGGMHKYIKPGLFLFLRGEGTPESKKGILGFNPVIVGFTGGIADIDVSDIYFKDNRVCYTSQIK